MSLLAPAGLLARNQTRLRDARSFQDLGALVVDDDPDGFSPVEGADGPVDFERAVREDVDGEAARAVLTQAGLVRGWTRHWQASEEARSTVDVELFQYRTHHGAVSDEARLERLVPKVAAANQLSWTTFAVPSVPGAHGYSLSAVDGSASVQVVSFARGDYAAAVTVVSSDKAEGRAVAVRMAGHQRARLSKLERLELVVSDGLQHVRR
jgi:hypothetical protein